MRYTRTVPAAAFALAFLAACGTSDAPVSPEAGDGAAERPATPVGGGGRQLVTPDDELARIAREEIPGFAGYYLAPDGRPIVRLVNSAQRARAEAYLSTEIAKSRVGRNARAFQRISFLGATYDFDQLKGWSDALHPMLDRGDVFLIDVDEVNNRVLVGVQDLNATAAVRAEAARLGVPQDALEARVQPKPEVRATVRDRFTTVVGGIQIAFGQYVCTQGFNARRVSNNQNIFVTNSHCTTVQNANDGATIYQNTNAAGNAIGVEVADRGNYACAGAGTSCRRADAAYISHNGTRTIGQGGIARTNWTTGSAAPLTVIGEFDIVARYTGTLPVGTYLDKTGRTSGSTYGLVTNSCVTIGSLRCQDISKVWSQGGDSGSPVYVYLSDNDVQLVGVMWGGPGSDYTTTYSSRLSGIEQDLGALTNLCRPGFGC